jgi:hypothetical protein
MRLVAPHRGAAIDPGEDPVDTAPNSPLRNVVAGDEVTWQLVWSPDHPDVVTAGCTIVTLTDGVSGMLVETMTFGEFLSTLSTSGLARFERMLNTMARQLPLPF